MQEPIDSVAAERDDIHDQLDNMRWWLLALTVLVGVALWGGDHD